jgi:plasmid stabilization system protein ParE
VRTVFLEGAENDLKELRRYLTKSFGKHVCQDSFQKIRDSVKGLQTFPQGDSTPDELVDLNFTQYRQVISGMNRIIYEVREEVIYIHIIRDTRQNLKSLLSRRLLR